MRVMQPNINNQMPMPPAQPPAVNNQMPNQTPPPTKNKSKFLILGAVGVLALVGVAFLVLFLVLGNNGSDNSANSNQIGNSENDATASTDQTSESDDTKEEDTTSADDTKEEDTTSSDPDSQATNPIADNSDTSNIDNSRLDLSAIGSGLFDLQLDDLRNRHAEEGTGQNQLQLSEEEIASARQDLIDTFQEMGIEESEIADFLAAYDYLMEDSNRQQLAELSDEQWAAIEVELLETLETFTASLLACSTEAISDLENLEDDQILDAAYDFSCFAEPLNQFGRDLLEVVQDVLAE